MLAHGYTNHVDGAVNSDGTKGYIAVNKNITVNGKAQRNVYIFEVALPSNYITRLVRSYIEGIDFPGPAGYSSVTYLPYNKLWVNLAATKSDGSNEVIWKSEVIDL